MTTIKSFTSLEQSRKLAEILPLESADMYYWLAWSGGVSKEERNTPKVGTPNKDAIKTYWCSCWSLAALISVLPNDTSLLYFDDAYQMVYDKKPYVISNKFDNPVDACVAMIEKLYELNLL